MDNKRSSLLIGSRTRRNVLIGKTVRKHDDGADNFADYWTDSSTDDTSITSNDKYSDVSYAGQSASQDRLQTLRSQNSKVLHSGTKIKDRQVYNKLLKSRLKHVKNNTLSCDKDIRNSLAKIQKLSSRLQHDNHQNSTVVLNNLSNSFNRTLVEDEAIVSARNFQHPINSEGESILTASTQSSNGNSEEQHIESNTSKHLANAVRGDVEINVSPLLPETKEKEKEISVSQRKLKSSISSKYFSKFPTCDDNSDISKCSENMLSPFSKEREKRNTDVMNVSNATVDAPDICISSSLRITSKEDQNPADASIAENRTLADKTLNEIRNPTEDREGSKIFVTSLGNCTVKKMKSSSDFSEKIAKYDKYDSEIMQMAHDNVNSLKMLEKKSDEEIYELAPKGTDVNLNETQSSYNCISSNELLTRRRKKNSLLREKIDTGLFQNKSVSHTKHSNIQIDEIEAANVSHIAVDTSVPHISEIEDETESANSDDLRKGYIDKSIKELRTSKYLSVDRFKNGSEIPEVVNQPTNFDNKKKKHVNEIHKNLNESENFSNKDTEKTTNIPTKENEITQNHKEKRKRVNKIHENLKGSETFSIENIESVTNISEKENEIVQNLDNKKRKPVSKIQKNLKASETFSIVNTESDTEVPAKKGGTTQNLVNKSKKQIKKVNEKLKTSEIFTENCGDIPVAENEITQNLDNKRKKCISVIDKNMKTLENISESFVSIAEISEVEDRIVPNLQNKNKTKKKLKGLETFSKGNRSAEEMPEAENGTNSYVNKRKMDASENLEDLSNIDDDASVSLSVRKKQKKSKIKRTEDTVPLRRSTRQKYPPLAKWRNERFLYRIENGIISVVGVDKGTDEDIGAIKHLLQNKSTKNRENKKRNKKVEVYDAVMKKNLNLSLIKMFDVVPWDTEFKKEERAYRIKKIFETPNSSSGFIEIQVNGIKPTQYMPNEDIYLTVVKGKVEIAIRDNRRVVQQKDMFVIPRCFPYSMKNVGTVKALLVFCVGRFKFVESEV